MNFLFIIYHILNENERDLLMYKNKKIGIVILNYKDHENTKKLCNLIEKYVSIDKIAVVDNLSPDSSFEILKKIKSKKIDVIQSDRNGGYSYGNNYGAFYLINKYKIDILFIANPDVEFDENFIIKCSEIINKDIVQATSGIMLDLNGKKSKWSGKINNFFEDLIDCTIFLKQFFLNYTFNYTYTKNELIYVDFLPGSLFAINANIFKRINGFDDNVFLYYEESILALKLRKHGYNLALCRDISFKHIHSASINKSIAKINQFKQLCNSKLYLHKKYLKDNTFQIYLLKLFIKYGILMRKLIYKILY